MTITGTATTLTIGAPAMNTTTDTITGDLLIFTVDFLAGHRDVPVTAVAVWMQMDAAPINAYAPPTFP